MAATIWLLMALEGVRGWFFSLPPAPAAAAAATLPAPLRMTGVKRKKEKSFLFWYSELDGRGLFFQQHCNIVELTSTGIDRILNLPSVSGLVTPVNNFCQSAIFLCAADCSATD
ncbi:hypothetical protein RUM44_010849 [Polyplax serrata]|uniref:Secreted protein n=1 Tax=Polyplax serrata TaxID=468196 RepID=A0ABR1ANE6_POLSC